MYDINQNYEMYQDILSHEILTSAIVIIIAVIIGFAALLFLISSKKFYQASTIRRKSKNRKVGEYIDAILVYSSRSKIVLDVINQGR